MVNQTMPKTQPDFASKLLSALSHERMSGYRDRLHDSGNNNLLAHYVWNMALSESLYPALQVLEITLRNAIHREAGQHFGRPDWYSDSIIHAKDRDAVSKAEKTLIGMRRPLAPYRIIAELKPCFPYMPRHQRTRKNLSARFEKIRRLRNRVFHHEPIWHWQNLADQHQGILEAIAWIYLARS